MGRVFHGELTMSKFKDKVYKNAMVVIHSWEKGILKTMEHFFNTVEDAVAYSTNHSKDEETIHIKVYNHHGECVHDDHCHEHDHYA